MRASRYTAAHMEWAEIRQHFKAERKRRKRTQTTVAEAGAEQSAISKIESDPTYTPQVDTFVKAVNGLGMPVWEFFRQLESDKVGQTPLTISALTDPAVPAQDGTHGRPSIRVGEVDPTLRRAVLNDIAAALYAASLPPEPGRQAAATRPGKTRSHKASGKARG